MSHASPSLAGKKLLLVDDDRAVIEQLRALLTPSGYTFVTARDGAGALAAVRDERPDLVLMDVEMPGLGGVQVVRILRANQGFGYVPIILMTARGAAGKVEGLELGADDFLVKPVEPLELAARVKSMLRLKALQDELIARNDELDRTNQALQESQRELERLSRTDALTGLFNRRYLEERFTGEFERSRRYRSALACLMFDIDHFKRLNDGYGHPFGDRVIRGTAEVLLRTMRDVDLVGRYGGEEFVALLPETGPDEALRVAERVRASIAQTPYETEAGELVRVTVSIGVANHPSPAIAARDELLRAADDALYKAKQAGRDRVVVSDA